MRRSLIVVLFCLFAGAAGAQHPPSIGSLGVAPTPVNFPRHTLQDLDQMFALTRDLGDTAVFIYPWSQPDLLESARNAIDLSRARGLTPIVSISPTVITGFRARYDAPSWVRSTVPGDRLSMADPRVHQAFLFTVLQLAAMNPEYLCLASEINLMAFEDLEEFVRFAGVYKHVYGLVKQISPQTRVFVSFQWDFQRVLDSATEGRTAALIELFRPHLDVLALTSYPSTQFAVPWDMPPTYYTEALPYRRPGEDVIFPELGWSSAGGNEISQQRFIEALPRLFAELRPKIAAWSLLHDVTVVLDAHLGATGLVTANGLPKPAYAAFRALRP